MEHSTDQLYIAFYIFIFKSMEKLNNQKFGKTKKLVSKDQSRYNLLKIIIYYAKNDYLKFEMDFWQKLFLFYNLLDMFFFYDHIKRRIFNQILCNSKTLIRCKLDKFC